MFFNYLKIAFRNILKQRAFSFITILGLATGLTCTTLILTFVVDEFGYDHFHSKKERIYRLRYFIGDFDIGRVPPVFKEHMNEFFPEVEASSRLWSRSVSVRVPDDSESDRRFEETNVNFADPEIFKIFDFELVSGSLDGALETPNTVILNDEIARKYFSSESPVGKTVIMEGNQSFQVIAVVKDFPSNSHTHFDMLLPYENMYDLEPPALAEGIRNNFKLNYMVSHSPTYVLLEEGSDPEEVNNRFVSFVEEKIPENQQKGQSFVIQPLLDIHLNNDVMAQSEAPGSRNFIYIFIAVGVLTLLIACINFINLSTAKSLQRAKEIGMRKVMGAWKRDLVLQFMGESFLTTAFAGVLAYAGTTFLLPELNNLTNKELTVQALYQLEITLGFLVILLITGFLAGLYPSFFVTRFRLLDSLKNSTGSTGNSLNLRKGLMVIQFMISIILIASTLIVFDQLNLMRNKPLGFQKELMVTAPIQSANFNTVFGGVDGEKRQKMNAFEDALESVPGVRGSTVSGGTPGFGMVNRNIIPEGFTAEDNMLSPVMAVDYDFIDVYEIELLDGRTFDESFGSDAENAFIINEEAIRSWNFGNVESALGKTINLEGKEGKVVGVVKDFNFLSLSEEMRPLIMEISVPQFSTFSIKIENQNIPETLDRIEAIWNDFFPNETFDAAFLDEALDESYQGQEQFGQLIGYFSFLAILISCLGSYGLIMFIAAEKRKEVGVRKVLGASVAQVVLLLSKRFVWLVVVAIFLSTPVIYYTGNWWLEDFSYRVNVSPLSISIASAVTIFLVFTTVSVHALMAAVVNPVKALRSE